MQHNGNRIHLTSSRSTSFRVLSVLLRGIFLVIFGCHHTTGGREPSASGIDTHTVKYLHSIAHFRQLTSLHDGELQTVKFIITDFGRRKPGQIIFMDGRFYSFHDEWYWYLRLNGHRALGDRGISDSKGCRTPGACVESLKHIDDLPIDLQFVDERLYSQRFYDLALASQREIGLGALLYRAETASSPPLFGFRLEYVDTPTSAEVLVYFQVLKKSLSPELAKQLVWLPRSPFQEKQASQMVSENQLHPEQVRPFSELASAGEAEIYNSGVAVGRLLLVEDNLSAVAMENDYILIFNAPPDELPQTAGLISAVPMTALCHVNILARNRGIPSGYVGGVFENPWIRQLSDGYAPVVLEMKNGEVKISPLSAAAYQRFRKPQKKTRFNPPASYDTAPYVVTLEDLKSKRRSDWQALVGGKSSGFEVLQSAVPSAIPRQVAIITTRAYRAHMASLDRAVRALLSHSAFHSSAKVRYFVLEGEQKYNETFATLGDRKLIHDLKNTAPLLFNAGRRGGLKQKIQSRALSPSVLAEITRELKRHFEKLPHSQGLRFRSSSTVEDVETFNGAGLYDSNTGFLYPSELETASDRARTVEWALKKTWASYWNFHAFEERRNAGIDHQSGAMGVVVHARFDDALEMANGVITFSWNFAGDYLVNTPLEQMVVNVQRGALSVTNPSADSDALPETAILTAAASGAPTILRQRPSEVNGNVQRVLSDEEYLEIFDLCRRIAVAWQKSRNRPDLDHPRRQTVTLDLEFKKMSGAWAGLDENNVATSTLVIKQVRSLGPTPLIPGILETELPVPRDVLLRATSVARTTCADSERQIKFLRISLSVDDDPMFASAQFVADLTIAMGARIEVLSAGEYFQPDPEDAIVFSDDATARLGVSQLRLNKMVCESKVLHSADAAVMGQYVKQGQVIGRVNAHSKKPHK